VLTKKQAACPSYQKNLERAAATVFKNHPFVRALSQCPAPYEWH